MMPAFPVGFALPIVLYLLTRRLPRSHWVSKIHPVMILSGGIHWAPLQHRLHLGGTPAGVV